MFFLFSGLMLGSNNLTSLVITNLLRKNWVSQHSGGRSIDAYAFKALLVWMPKSPFLICQAVNNLPRCEFSKLPNCQDVKLSIFPYAESKLSSYHVVRDCKVAELPSCRAVELSSCIADNNALVETK